VDTSASVSSEQEETAVTDVQGELDFTIAEVKRFLEEYGQYMESSQAMKIRRDLEQAEHALGFYDEAECTRMINVLHKDLFSSGAASQLVLAERATDSAAPALAREIQEAVFQLQSSYHSGNRALVEAQAMHLNSLIGRAFRDRNVDSVDDHKDYGGLLSVDVTVEDLVVGFAAVKVLGPFLETFAGKLGERLGESTAQALARVRLWPGRLAIGFSSSPVETQLVLPEDFTDEAKLAMIDLDVACDEVQGQMLHWDQDSGEWKLPDGIPAPRQSSNDAETNTED
jgi:hypothetical protein